MPAKIRFARASYGKTIGVEEAAAGSKTRNYNPLTCIGKRCEAVLVFVNGTNPERKRRIRKVSPYFRRKEGEEHALTCTFRDLAPLITAIADDAPPGLMREDGDPYTRFRLLAARKAFREFEDEMIAVPRNAPDNVWQAKFESSGRKLDPYLSTAQKILKLRALILGSEMQKELELTYEDRPISWDEFYFEHDDYDVCCQLLMGRNRDVPAAIEGTVAYAGPQKTNDGRVVGLLRMNALQFPDPDDPGVTISYQPSIWSDYKDEFKDYSPGQTVLAFGLWTAKDGGLNKSKTYWNFYVSLSLLWPTQVCAFKPD